MNSLINTVIVGYPVWQWFFLFVMFDIMCVPSMWSIKDNLREIVTILKERK
jgi:hypothetical protein